MQFPKIIEGRELYEGYQCVFFEALALPEEVLRVIKINEEEYNNFLRAFSQWRLDFPYRSSDQHMEDIENQVISVLDKLLRRGRITLLTHNLEDKLRKLFGIDKEDTDINLIKSLVLKGYRLNKERKIKFDSYEERIFYEDILPDIMGDGYEFFVLPQIKLTSLIESEEGAFTDQRVDFVIFHPELQKGIVIEIDGGQHAYQRQWDRERDAILSQHGYMVIRIPANEVRNGKGEKLSSLAKLLEHIKRLKTDDLSSYQKYLLAIKIAHQIQISLLYAIRYGFLNIKAGKFNIASDLNKIGIFSKEESYKILELSVNDFFEILGNVCKIYSFDVDFGNINTFLADGWEGISLENSIFLSFYHEPKVNFDTFYIQNIYTPFDMARHMMPAKPVIGGLRLRDDQNTKEILEYFLRYIFRKKEFREGQFESIVRILEGKDVLILLPTGAGKSLIYQLASFLLPGITVIIDPIVSLMDDQIYNLSLIGIDRSVAITSQGLDAKGRNKVYKLFGIGEYIFVFIAPERFQTEEFRNSLVEFTVSFPVSLIVIDEVHCVSEWGHDFRIAYLNIGKTSREYCKSQNHTPPLIGLTATASRAVLRDIQHALNINDVDARHWCKKRLLTQTSPITTYFNTYNLQLYKAYPS